MNDMIFFVVCERKRRTEGTRYLQSLNTMGLQLSQSCQLKLRYFIFKMSMLKYATGFSV